MVVRKPASPGREHVRTVVLQGHLDMVCEKNKDTVHDFLKDPIVLVRKGDVLMADGTTLGADNGVAVATNLAIMEDKSLEHGPLEFLFTVDEETGLTGANALAGDLLTGKTLLNLDSEEEGALYVGCSGGRNTTARWALATDAAPADRWPRACSRSRACKGGHSGLEIDKNRGNSIKILARVAVRARPSWACAWRSIEGGNKHNAIPREAEALVFVPKKAWPVAAELVARCQATLRAELGERGSRPEPDAHREPRARGGARSFKKAVQMKVLQTLVALPHGVIKMSTDIPGLVETSTNVASIKSTAKAVDMVTSQRSSVASEIDEICDTVRVILELGGAEVKQGDGYPGWKPNLDSEILKVAKDTYKSLYGKTPEVKAIHAGLECGIIGEKYPGMDMLSFGPTLEGVHSPDEKMLHRHGREVLELPAGDPQERPASAGFPARRPGSDPSSAGARPGPSAFPGPGPPRSCASCTHWAVRGSRPAAGRGMNPPVAPAPRRPTFGGRPAPAGPTRTRRGSHGRTSQPVGAPPRRGPRARPGAARRGGPAARAAAAKLRVPYTTFTLPNGLQVILHEDHSLPIVSVNTWYHVGSGDEKPGRTGFAHLFEHIMFMGSQHVPTGDFDRLLEAAGADNNGSTIDDRTNYYEDGPANALPLMLWLDSDRMGFLSPR